MPSLLMETTKPFPQVTDQPVELSQKTGKPIRRKKQEPPKINDPDHSHFLFIPQAEGGGDNPLTSINSNHGHSVFFNEQTEEYEIAPGGEDQHIHEIIEFNPRSRNMPDRSDDDMLGELDNKHLESLEEHSDYKEKSERAEGLVSGIEEHWDKQTESQLDAEKRAHHTTNFILQNFLFSSGLQRSRRNDITPRPREGSDMFIADILKQLIKGVQSNNLFEYEETDATDDQRITGRGNLRCVWSTERNLSGEIIIEHRLWDQVHYGAHNRKDLRDCRYVIFHEWQTADDLMADYPDKAKEITTDFDTVLQFLSKFEKEQKDRTTSTTSTTTRPMIRFGVRGDRPAEWWDIDKKSLLKLEMWKKVTIPVHVAVVLETNFYFGMEGLSKEDVTALETIPGMSVIPQKKFELWRLVAAGNTVLEEEFDQQYGDILPSFALYGFKRRNVIFGIVWPAEDMQLALNKLYSQVSDIINAAAGYIEYYDGNTFFSTTEETNWKKFGNTPGYKAKVKSIGNIPIQRTGTKVPSELFQLILLFDQTLSRVMAINPEFRGESGRAKSGIAIQRENQQTELGQEYLFDNTRLPLINMGRLIIKLIQNNYSVDRIMRELESQAQTEEFELAGKKFSEIEKSEIKKRLNDADLAQFDVSVDISQSSPSIMNATFFTLLEMKNAGINIPDDMVIPFVPGLSFKQKQDAIKRIQEQFGQEQALKQQTVDMEMGKTETAAKGKIIAEQIKKS